MWGKSQKPGPEPPPAAVALPVEPPRMETPAPRAPVAATRIGPALQIRGEIRGGEDVLIEGDVQGSVNLSNANVTVGRQGRVRADIDAREITVQGRVEGALTAKERVRIAATGVLHGNVRAQRIAIDDGAILQGAVDIVRAGESRPASQPIARAHAAAASALADSARPVERTAERSAGITGEASSLEPSAEILP